MKQHLHFLGAACAAFLFFPTTGFAPPPAAPPRAALWVDALRGEPLTFDELLAELQPARIIYLGEYHSIPRHHELETQLLQDLAGQGRRLVLAMEQFECTAQPALDQFNAGTLDLPALIAQSHWDTSWPTHTNYHPLLLAARQHAIPVLALNARSATIRAIGQRGLAELSPAERRELPATLVTDDPLYERLLNRALSVHMAFDPAKLRPVFEAQVARDETMAARLTAFLNSPAGQGRTALVICGRGHCEFGLGTPDRVARRTPGIAQRIVLLSSSGDLTLTEQELKQSRAVDLSHQFLRDLGRAPADFFHIIQTASPGP
ncbi:MAG TPA: ChaN family lipoprotein [Bacillota bacterium]|nr:ChaN family lipoprotein [Bacillota bacterium]